MIRKYTEAGKTIVEIYDLSFLKEREHSYGWLKRHFLHFNLKLALRNADKIYVNDIIAAVDLVRYYFVPKEKIVVNAQMKSPSHKTKRRHTDAD